MALEELHEDTVRLLECVEHWADNYARAVRGEELSLGWSACALCLRYNHPWEEMFDFNCEGCPVAEYSGERWCRETPYRWIERSMAFPKTGVPLVVAVLAEYQMLVEYAWRHWEEHRGDD